MGIFFHTGCFISTIYQTNDLTSYNMIKMGGVIQGEITRLVLRISGVINYFYLLETLNFCLVYVHVYNTRC